MADLRVLSAEAEGPVVYVLLSDDRILRSRDLETNHCAQLHAKQVMDIPLTPAFLEGTLGFKVVQDA